MPVENPQTQSLLAQVQCSRGNPCQCVIDKFSTLTDNGFVHEVTQNGPIIHRFLNPEKRLTAFDVLCGFTNDSIAYALPVNTLSKRVEYNCSSDILSVITSPGGELRVFPFLMNLTKVRLTVGMFNLTSPSVAQLLMEGNWTIGESDLVAFITIDAIQGNSWNLKGYMFETEVNLMKLLLAMKVDFPLPDHTHYSINVSKVYGQYNAGDFIVLTFEGIIQAGNWFVDEGCLVVYQSLHRLSANSRPHAALETGCSGQVTITEYGNLLLPHYAWNIMGVDVSGLGFFSNLQLQDARMLVHSSDYNIPDIVLLSTPLQNAIQLLKDTTSLSFVFSTNFQSGRKLIIVQFCDNQIEFTPASSEHVFTLHDFRRTVLEASDMLPTPSSLLDDLEISDLKIQTFILTVNPATSVSLEARAIIENEITVIEDVLMVNKPIFHFQYVSSTSKRRSVASFSSVSSYIEGHFALGDAKIPTTIAVDLPSDAYQVDSGIDRVSKENLVETFKFTFPSEFDTLGLSAILAKAKVHVSSATDKRQLCFNTSGTHLSGLSNLQ